MGVSLSVMGVIVDFSVMDVRVGAANFFWTNCNIFLGQSIGIRDKTNSLKKYFFKNIFFTINKKGS